MRSVFVAALLVSSVAAADIAPDPLAGGSDIAAIDETKAEGVAMKSEDVIVELYDSFAVIDANFVMNNTTAEARTLEVGFPGLGVMAGKRYSAHRALIGFQAWVAGKRATAEAREKTHTSKGGPPGHEYTKTRRETWHLFSATLPANATTTIRVRYGVLADAFLGDSYGSADRFPDSTVFYILSTGSRWKDNIGQAVVTVRAKGKVPIDSVRVRDDRMPPARSGRAEAEPISPLLPDYAKKGASEIVLTRKDFEPSPHDDLQIVFRPKLGKERGLEWNQDPALLKQAEETVAKAPKR
jgi:hypothetical protein